MSKPKGHPRLRVIGLALYYFLILVVVLFLHGRSGLATPSFIYQGF